MPANLTDKPYCTVEVHGVWCCPPTAPICDDMVLLAVNAGRVSYDRWHNEMTDRDRELIQQFADDGDTSPFYHSVATFRITAPLPVKVQLTRHNVGFSAPNEVSRRYTSRNIMVHSPEVWRDVNGEQLTWSKHHCAKLAYETSVQMAVSQYEALLDLGVAREQARFVLPQGMMVTVLWTANLYGWYNLCLKRLDPRAQLETQAVAEGIAATMATAFPVSWPALMEN